MQADLTLVLHTAVDYIYGQGAGIGILQRVECSESGKTQNNLIPRNLKARGFGIKREKRTLENIRTAQRAELLALVHALGLAHGTIGRGTASRNGLWPSRVSVAGDSERVAKRINYYRTEKGAEELKEVKSADDFSMITRVLAQLRRLEVMGIEVEIAVAREVDRSSRDAKSLARRRGSKAIKSRHRG
jgi:ribonuclease HI